MSAGTALLDEGIKHMIENSIMSDNPVLAAPGIKDLFPNFVKD